MQLLAHGCPNMSSRPAPAVQQAAPRLAVKPGNTSTRISSRRRGRLIRAQDNHRGSSNEHNSENDSYNIGSSTLYAHRSWLRRQRVLHSEPHPSDGDIIELNVGGSIMVTSRSTLRQVRGSLLALLFDPDNTHLLVRDAAGRVFLDHDPSAFSLALRYLRELRVTGGCPSSVLLPPLPPCDAAAFRSLAAYLGLQIDDAAITAAAARGASVAAGPGSYSGMCSSYSAGPGGPGGYYRPPTASPYASRPAFGSSANSSSSSGSCAQSQQQQQWWQRQQQQWQQRQHQLMRPQLPEVPPSGMIHGKTADPNPSTVRFRLGGSSSTSSSSTSSSGSGNSSSSREPFSTPGSASAAGVNGRNIPAKQQQQQQQRQRQHWGGSSNSRNVGPTQRPQSPPTAWQRPESYKLPPQQQQQQLVATVADPVVQYYYLRTSPPAAAAAAAPNMQSPAAVAPFRVGVLTEGDLAAQATNSSRSPTDTAGFWSSGGGFGDSYGGLPAGFDVFCSTSSSRHLLTFSLVARERAGLDNLFIGVTSANHTDQRGLQIPCFGWRQLGVSAGEEVASAAECPTEYMYDSSSNAAAGNHAGTTAAAATAAGTMQGFECPASSGSAHHQQKQHIWQAGDLVQLVVELGSTNKLLLKVNGQEVTGYNNNLELPTFRQWCWYLALFRGTDVVAVVFEQGSYSVYSGDYRMKRFLA